VSPRVVVRGVGVRAVGVPATGFGCERAPPGLLERGVGLLRGLGV
jgi:hypothetical protein